MKLMKRFFSLALILALCLPLCAVNAEAAVARTSKVSRNDGTWLFPLAQNYYNRFTDWAAAWIQ